MDTPIDQATSPSHRAIKTIVEQIVTSACKQSKDCPYQDLMNPTVDYLFKVVTDENAATAFLENRPWECKETYSLFAKRCMVYMSLVCTVMLVLQPSPGQTGNEWTKSQVFQLVLIVAFAIIVPFLN